MSTLWLTPRPIEVPGDDVAIVVDLTWTPGVGSTGGPRSARAAAERVLARLDPIDETSRLLDAWAAASGVVEVLTIGGTSFWYRVRLAHWLWLQDHVLWAAILRELLDELHPAALACAVDVDEALGRGARLVAEADGLPFRLVAADGAARPVAAAGVGNPSRRAAAVRRPLPVRIARRVVAAVRRRLPGARTGESLAARLARLAAEPEPRLLVFQTQVPQHVETEAGPRVMNPNLGPIVDRLHGTSLEPIVIDRYADRATPGPGADRVLPLDVVRRFAAPGDALLESTGRRAAATIAGVEVPIATAGIDLGPALARRVADDAAGWLGRAQVTVARMRRLIDRLPVRAILVADEYHRQDALEAASQAGIPVAAVQHGTIYRRHNGYIHGDRPPQLNLPDRTYVFGRWERDLLVRDSVYREDEVVVGGSPRLDLFRPAPGDRDAVRAELGVVAGERLLVLSGTYGAIYRRIVYPLLLARLFDRPMPGVRLVVKQHPAEADEGPYRAVIEGVAAAGGFAPPPIRLVRDVDLYRLLAAADAHLGIHSTVLTEAVFVGTPNLLAGGVRGGDLLDYVAAGVALPVADGGELLDALAAIDRGAITAAAREAFIAAHFEPGSATERIAGDLLAWLT
jgi:hypothetical protein